MNSREAKGPAPRCAKTPVSTRLPRPDIRVGGIYLIMPMYVDQEPMLVFVTAVFNRGAYSSGADGQFESHLDCAVTDDDDLGMFEVECRLIRFNIGHPTHVPDVEGVATPVEMQDAKASYQFHSRDLLRFVRAGEQSFSSRRRAIPDF